MTHYPANADIPHAPHGALAPELATRLVRALTDFLEEGVDGVGMRSAADRRRALRLSEEFAATERALTDLEAVAPDPACAPIEAMTRLMDAARALARSAAQAGASDARLVELRGVLEASRVEQARGAPAAGRVALRTGRCAG